MEHASASISFSLQGANESPLQILGFDPFVAAGAGSEEQPALDVSDYDIPFDEESQPEEYYSALFAAAGQYSYQDPFLPAEGTGESSMVSPTTSSLKCVGGVQKENNMDEGRRYIFRTKSEKDVLADGYKWRKYGKKSVKNGPYKRNYYKCSAEGCGVKKRVERDRENHSYVLTTYEGEHCHPPPDEVYYPVVPRAQAAASASGPRPMGSFYRPGDPCGVREAEPNGRPR